jgi:methionine-rich copper-binding protein CopC
MLSREAINIFKNLFLSILLLLPMTAIAHSPLASSTPMDGEILDMPPAEIVMVFKSPTKLIKVNIKKLSQKQSKSLLGGLFGTDDSEPVLLGKIFLMKIGTHHVISLPYLKIGDYKLAWRAMGKDGHVIKGKLAFTIADN